MNILFYTVLFIIGIVIGNYLAKKSMEIPKTLDLKKTYYSSNNEFMSKITYIFTGGILSIILAKIVGIDIYEFDISKNIIYVFSMIYISTLILIGGIDKNYTKIDKKLLGFGIISSIIYMLYSCVIDMACLYLQVIYIAIYLVLLLIDCFLLRKFAKDSYRINLLTLLAIILVFTDLRILIYTLIMAIIAILLYIMLLKIQENKTKNKQIKINEIPIGYFITTSNIVVLLIIRIFENYLI